MLRLSQQVDQTKIAVSRVSRKRDSKNVRKTTSIQAYSPSRADATEARSLTKIRLDFDKLDSTFDANKPTTLEEKRVTRSQANTNIGPIRTTLRSKQSAK